jgi:hypothetical protein
MALVAILKVAGLLELIHDIYAKINLEIQGTSSLQGVPKQNQDTAIGRIIVELLYQRRVSFFSVQFNYEAIFQGYKKHNVAQTYGVHNLAAVDSFTGIIDITRYSKYE